MVAPDPKLVFRVAMEALIEATPLPGLIQRDGTILDASPGFERHLDEWNGRYRIGKEEALRGVRPRHRGAYEPAGIAGET